MKVELSRKDVLRILLDRASKFALSGDYVAAVAIEVGRAAIKRVPVLNEQDVVRYLDPGTGLYVEVKLESENDTDPKFPASEKD